jgi:hypothetical protein
MQPELQDIENYIVWDVKTIINYIISHYKQCLLLLVSFIIIFMVDYITHYNNSIVNAPSIINGFVNNSPILTPQHKRIKSKKSRK